MKTVVAAWAVIAVYASIGTPATGQATEGAAYRDSHRPSAERVADLQPDRCGLQAR